MGGCTSCSGHARLLLLSLYRPYIMATSEPPNDKAPLVFGYMSKMSMSGLIKHWNKRFFVLYGFKSKGSIRLEYYDDEISQKIGAGRRVTTPLGRHMLAAEDQNMLDKWVNGIRSAVKRFMLARFQAKKGGSRQSSSSSVASTSSTASTASTAAKLPPGVLFRDKVVAVRTDGAKKANLSGSYVLVVTNKGMVLYCPSTKSKVASWGYKAIRTYGKNHKAFHFETGRSSEFGQCRFEFEHKNPKEIFLGVDASIKSLAAVPRDERQSAGELRQPPRKERPVRAQSMYTPTIPEDSNTSSSESTRTTSIHLENPLQQLKALHQSFDNRPVSYSDSRGKYHSNSLEGADDIFWEEDVDLTDFSDMTDFHNSPPSYLDVLQRDKTKTTTTETSTNADVFGSDPFSGFGENSHSFIAEHKTNSPATPPLQIESSETPFDTSPFATSSPNQQSVPTSPFDEFGPLATTTPPGDPWGQTDNVLGTEQLPLANPFTETSMSSTEIPTSNPWGTTKPVESPTPDPWGTTEPAESPSSNPWGTTKPVESPTPDPWGTTEPAESPSSNPWGTTEPAESPSSGPWGNIELAVESPTSNPWGTGTEFTAESPSSSPWGNAETPAHESTPTQVSQGNRKSQPKLTHSDAVSEVQQSQTPLLDPWNFSDKQDVRESSRVGSSSQEAESNTAHLLRDLDNMTQSLFSEIADIQLMGSN